MCLILRLVLFIYGACACWPLTSVQFSCHLISWTTEQCSTLGSPLFAHCIPSLWMYQSLISYGETLVNDALSARITPRKTVFPSTWDALKGGQRAPWIYALSKIKRWTSIILSFPGIWGSLRTGTTDNSFTKQLNWDILPGQCGDLDSMPTFINQRTLNLGFRHP